MKRNLQIILSVVGVIAVIVCAYWLNQYASQHDIVREWIGAFGYAGLFLVSVVSGFNVLVPIPAASFVPTFVTAGHNIWLTLAVVTVGMTLGDSVGYGIGKAGRTVVTDTNKIKKRLEALQQKYYNAPLIVLFLYACFAPAPNELLVIPMGFMGYQAKHMLPIILCGNMVFNTLTAFGLMHIFKIVG